MSEHLPECPTAWMRDCICTELRLCEQRIREEWYEAQSEAWEQGFHHALDAARRAVDSALDAPPQHNVRVVAQIALAAIDALRGSQK